MGCGLWDVGSCRGNKSTPQYTGVTPIMGLWDVGRGLWVVGCGSRFVGCESWVVTGIILLSLRG